MAVLIKRTENYRISRAIGSAAPRLACRAALASAPKLRTDTGVGGELCFPREGTPWGLLHVAAPPDVDRRQVVVVFGSAARSVGNLVGRLGTRESRANF